MFWWGQLCDEFKDPLFLSKVLAEQIIVENVGYNKKQMVLDTCTFTEQNIKLCIDCIVTLIWINVIFNIWKRFRGYHLWLLCEGLNIVTLKKKTGKDKWVILSCTNNAPSSYVPSLLPSSFYILRLLSSSYSFFLVVCTNGTKCPFN